MHSKFVVPTFVYFQLPFDSEMDIVLFDRAFYLVEVTSTIAIKSQKRSQN